MRVLRGLSVTSRSLRGTVEESTELVDLEPIRGGAVRHDSSLKDGFQ